MRPHFEKYNTSSSCNRLQKRISSRRTHKKTRPYESDIGPHPSQNPLNDDDFAYAASTRTSFRPARPLVRSQGEPKVKGDCVLFIYSTYQTHTFDSLYTASRTKRRQEKKARTITIFITKALQYIEFSRDATRVKTIWARETKGSTLLR